jgi:hypothetical protein
MLSCFVFMSCARAFTTVYVEFRKIISFVSNIVFYYFIDFFSLATR